MAALVAGFVLLVFGGIGAWFDCSPAPPPVVVVERSEIQPGPVDRQVAGDEWRLVESGDRLDVEDLRAYGAPVEDVHVRRDLSPRVEDAVRIGGARPAVAVTPNVGPIVEGLGCNSAYREMLKAYDGSARFSAQVAQLLAEELVVLRPDCGDEGWSPEVKLGRVCTQDSVSGIRLPNGLLRYEGGVGSARSVGTVRDEVGNILVHFQKAPLHDGSACWFYDVERRRWAWFVTGVGNGVDGPRHPVCEARLRLLIAEGARTGPVDTYGVARWVDQVHLEYGDQCPSQFWRPYATMDGDVDCGDGWGTGVVQDGRIVVNWRDGFSVGSGAVCWVLAPGGSEWEEYFRSQ